MTARGPTPTGQPPILREECRCPTAAWINDLPTAFFMVVHIAAFALGAGFAWLASSAS